MVAAAHMQAFRLPPGTYCVLGTARSMGKGTNKTDTAPVLRQLTAQEDLRATDQACRVEGRAETSMARGAWSVTGTGLARRKVFSQQTRLRSKEEDLA